MASGTEDKPFCCNYPGCRQKFANVDRLNVHQETHNKQDSSLKIKMGLVKTGDQLVDQTPTPTRFLKNCDEEGLFQELNPFAMEMKARIQSTGSDGAQDDGPSAVETLAAVASVVSANASPTHTSSASEVFENSNGAGTPTAQLLSPVSNSDGRAAFSGPFYTTGVVVPVPPPAAIANPDASIPMAVAPMNLLPKLSTSVGSPSSKSGVVAANTKKRLQEVIGRQAAQRDAPEIKQDVGSPPRLVMPTTVSPRAVPPLQPTPKLISKPERGGESPSRVVLSMTSMSPETAVSTSGVSSSADSTASPTAASPSTPELISKPGRRRAATEDLGPAEKRARFLLRNREAATRCREKRKQWIQTLEKRSQELARQNAQLQSEVASLRNERAHLKLLLLSHKDCPVTLQQQKQLNTATPKAPTTATAPTPTIAAAATTGITSPITPLVMFPLTPDGLQVAAAAAAATPTIDLSALNFLQQFQQSAQQQQQRQQQTVSQPAAQPQAVPLTPSAQQLQALFNTAQQLSLLQMIQQQQQQQQQPQQHQQDARSENAPTPSDGSLEVQNGTDSEVTVVEIAMEAD